MEKRICIVTTTRADWGLLMPLARRLAAEPAVRLQLVASNMHLMPEFGMTVNEITDAGFTVDERVEMAVAGDDEASRVRAMAMCFERLRPDCVVLLGDRYEMLAVASAAAVMRLPIVHIAGGEVSEGAVDDSIRHAITKLSTLHLTATEAYRRRVIQMGEEPDTVVNTGAIGVWNAFNIKPLDSKALEEFLNLRLDGDIAVVTFHPATNDSSASPAEQASALLEALDAFPGLKCVITYPNNDAGGASIIPLLKSYAERNRDRVRLFQSLGMLRYHSLLRHASVVIGNSSSGIVEVPSAGIPTVDIGIRQRGRISAPSVIHCGSSASDIAEAIAEALSPKMRALAGLRQNPYYKAGTLDIMIDSIMALADSLPAKPKHFHDL